MRRHDERRGNLAALVPGAARRRAYRARRDGVEAVADTPHRFAGYRCAEIADRGKVIEDALIRPD